MYKLCVFVLVVLMGFTVLVGCDQKGQKDPTSSVIPSVIEKKDKYDVANFGSTINLHAAITIGNHSYIPLNMDPSSNARESEIPAQRILETLDAFEKDNPKLKVTGWKIESKHSSYGSSAFTFGLWVDHEPKAISPPYANRGPEITPPSPRPSVSR